MFAGHRSVRGRRPPPHNGRSLPSRHHFPTRDVVVTRHQQELPGSRPIPVLPLTCGRHGWDDGPWAFPRASHPTDQEPATHVAVGTGRTQTRSYVPGIRRTSSTSSLTTCDFASQPTPTPASCSTCTSRSPKPPPASSSPPRPATPAAGTAPARRPARPRPQHPTTPPGPNQCGPSDPVAHDTTGRPAPP